MKKSRKIKAIWQRLLKLRLRSLVYLYSDSLSPTLSCSRRLLEESNISQQGSNQSQKEGNQSSGIGIPEIKVHLFPPPNFLNLKVDIVPTLLSLLYSLFLPRGPFAAEDKQGKTYPNEHQKSHPAVKNLHKAHSPSFSSNILTDKYVKNNPPRIARKLSRMVAAEEIAGTNNPARNIPLAISKNKSDNFSTWEELNVINLMITINQVSVN